ncbi:MAG TPA: TAT-dependent nitrous-oxide reductase, partial [Dongiaceae bacterium]|nr:TAT-dependent nitrous-oxide reductase [Dongiaceae bacterium]
MSDKKEEGGPSVSRRSLLNNTAKAAALAGVAGVAGGGIAELGSFARPARADTKQTGEVRPGDLDEYYGFSSSGQTGEVRIVAIPSM